MRCLAALLLLVSLAGVAKGEDFSNLHQSIDCKPLIEDIKLQLPPAPVETNYLNSLSLTPTSTFRKYEGLEGVVVDRVNSYLNRYFQQTINNVWTYGSTNLVQFQDWANHQYLESYDFTHGQWADRSWEQSLVGASILKPVIIGKDLEIFQLGDFSLTNTGKIKITDKDQIQFYFKSLWNSGDITKNLENSNPSVQLKINSFNKEPKSTLPPGNLYTGEIWTISWTPKVSLRFSQFYQPRTILNSVENEFQIKLYTHKEKLWSAITINFQSEPIQKTYSCFFNWEIFIN